MDKTAARTPRSPEMLDDPGLARQWLLRRLQKALTTELATAAFARGLHRRRASDAGAAQMLRTESEARVALLCELIDDLGSRPYSSFGLARAAARTGGRVLAFLGPWSWRAPARRLANHELSEYDALAAFARSSLIADASVRRRTTELLESARRVHERLGDEA